MHVLKMDVKYLDEFLASLGEFGTLYGPTRRDGVLTYERLDNIKELEITTERPLIPVKKLFHPKRFDMFTYDGNGFTPNCSLFEKRVLIGVHPCDIHSLLKLDRLYLADPADPYYKGLRECTAIVGFSCLPDENCLCKSTGTDIIEQGFDLFFVKLNGFYLVWVGSSLGHDMVLEKEEFFDSDVTPRDIQEYIDWREMRDGMFQKSFDFKNMPDVIELSYNSADWEYFGEKCLSCGQCSMVCPTCSCFHVHDIPDIGSENTGRRERMWDSCMFVDFSLVAGGHNFRKQRADRLKLWYTHKLKTLGREYGNPGCVGCGRCLTNCPVDINVLTVSEALLSEGVPK
ncbi:MAG: 4Fe-4S dicluster domain-containing protein [Candidatus Thorarchaeota archaeon]